MARILGSTLGSIGKVFQSAGSMVAVGATDGVADAETDFVADSRTGTDVLNGSEAYARMGVTDGETDKRIGSTDGVTVWGVVVSVPQADNKPVIAIRMNSRFITTKYIHKLMVTF